MIKTICKKCGRRMQTYVLESPRSKEYEWSCPICQLRYKQRVRGLSRENYFSLIRGLKEHGLTLVEAKCAADAFCQNWLSGRKPMTEEKLRERSIRNVDADKVQHVLLAHEVLLKILHDPETRDRLRQRFADTGNKINGNQE